MHYHSVQSENILIWTLDPLVVRLSDAGVMEKSHKCTVCCNIDTTCDTCSSFRCAQCIRNYLTVKNIQTIQ